MEFHARLVDFHANGIVDFNGSQVINDLMAQLVFDRKL